LTNRIENKAKLQRKVDQIIILTNRIENKAKLQRKVDQIIESGVVDVVEFPSGIDCRIKNTNIYFVIYTNGLISGFFKDRIEGGPSFSGKNYRNFEEVLDSLDETMQTELLFHLDLFTGL
jgi:hypothetical protein